MKKTAGRSADVVCPFYRRDTPQTVTCEGLVQLSTIRQAFGRVEDCEIHVSTFCCRHYRNCEIYQAIMNAKYSE